MKRRIIFLMVGIFFLSSHSLSFAVERVQTKPGAVQTKPVQLAPMELPDLVVESIWLDGQCQINFKLKNVGKGNISDGEHRESAVRIQFGSEIKDLPLGRIDPNGALKKGGGFVSFNTQVVLKSSVDVKVIADFSRKIKETDPGEKNNEKVTNLTPQCPSVAKVDLKTKTLADEGGKPQTSDVPLQKSRTLTGIPPGQGGILADTVPLNITILSPTKNSSWNIGSNLNIKWKGIPSAGNFHILLKTLGMADILPSGTGEPAVASIISYTKMQPNQQGVFNYDWKIPSYITPQDYIVKIIYADDPKVFSKSEVFKINKGGPSIITPKTLYSGPPVKGFGVELFCPYGKCQAGESTFIYWQVLDSIFSDKNSLDQMEEKVRIVLKDMGGTERLVIAKDVANRRWIDWQSFKWSIPEGFPDGQYIVRVETPDGHFYGESLPFTIWNPKVAKMAEVDKQVGSVQDQIIMKGITPPPPPVTGTFKVLSMTPVMGATQLVGDNRLYRIDLTVEIDASSDFQLVGEQMPKNPMLKPVSLQPHLGIRLTEKFVDAWPKSYNSGHQNYQFGVNFMPLFYEREVLEWLEGYCGKPGLTCPTGVLKKGKNVYTFSINVQSIPQSENNDKCNPSWWAPLSIRRNVEFNEYHSDTGKTTKLIIAVTENYDLLIQVYLQIYGGGFGGASSGSLLKGTVSQPRGSKYLMQGWSCISN